jgi:histidinol-phosphate aminotransferase
MAVQVWGREGARFVIADPTFEDVPGYAAPWNLDVVKVPLRPDHSHDLERMAAQAARADGPAMVYICNPNNPTGTLTPCDEVDAWIERASDQVTFLIDEAYLEYAESASSYWSEMKWIASRPNVVIVRTFSKIFGMAGMRLGYGIAHPDTAARLRALASHSNANHLACMAALASLADQGLVSRSLEVNARARRAVTEVLDELELAHLPSHTNFMMHRINGELDAYRTRMEDAGYLVGRPFPPMLQYNRVSFGLPEDMEGFADTLRTFRQRGWV